MEIFIEFIVGMVDENDRTCEPWIGNRVKEMKDVGTFRVTLAKSVEVIIIISDSVLLSVSVSERGPVN